jgi:hypothetical protein
MPKVTVTRSPKDGPFHKGDGYDFVPDDADEHFKGVVCNVELIESRIRVTVELSDEEYERMQASSNADARKKP